MGFRFRTAGVFSVLQMLRGMIGRDAYCFQMCS